MPVMCCNLQGIMLCMEFDDSITNIIYSYYNMIINNYSFISNIVN